MNVNPTAIIARGRPNYTDNHVDLQYIQQHVMILQTTEVTNKIKSHGVFEDKFASKLKDAPID